jgi:uncharacterized RDD family membrane protein YckC
MSDYGLPAERPADAADFTKRFLARLIDGLVLGVAVYGILAAVLASVLISGPSSAGAFGYGGAYLFSAVLALLGTAVQLGYFALFETRGEPTLGKRIMKLNVLGPQGGPLTLEQSVKRNFFYALGLLGLVPILGALSGFASLAAVIWVAVTINSSPTGQGGHDKLAGGTRVVSVPDPA